jgi:hypothetical protein
MTPFMTEAEAAVLSKHYLSSRKIVEYGSGGSTFLAVTGTEASVASVESDIEWIGKMREMPEIAAAESSGRLRLIHVDIGPTGRWGFPVDESRRENWPKYAACPWDAQTTEADLVFVDGRFRVACILTTILKTQPGTRILVHDFWNREHYHVVLPHLIEVERVETLGVFRRPEVIDEKRLANEFEEFTYCFE